MVEIFTTTTILFMLRGLLSPITLQACDEEPPTRGCWLSRYAVGAQPVYGLGVIGFEV